MDEFLYYLFVSQHTFHVIAQVFFIVFLIIATYRIFQEIQTVKHVRSLSKKFQRRKENEKYTGGDLNE